MIKISLTESFIIGIITIICGLIIQKITDLFGNDIIKEENVFNKYKNYNMFYLFLFIIGILIHIFIQYAEFNEWYCEKKCINDACEILCHLPINAITKLIITK